MMSIKTFENFIIFGCYKDIAVSALFIYKNVFNKKLSVFVREIVSKNR